MGEAGEGPRCKCTYDPAYHAQVNASRGHSGDRCHNPQEDPSAHDLCTPCLFGCAP